MSAGKLKVARELTLGFAGIILLGGILLSFPISSRTGVPTPFLNALFTATSATCVTGLVVYDTWSQFSFFGQLVILLLIQCGGLGFMTRISENKLVIQKQDEVIDDVIEEATKHTRHLMRTHQFKVFLPDEVVTAKMDGKLIVQVVINLLENAARHTPEGGIISLETHADRDTVYVTVRDQGEGIAREVKEHLFEPFVTQDSSTIPDAHHGIGLGLAICRSIVTAHVR